MSKSGPAYRSRRVLLSVCAALYLVAVVYFLTFPEWVFVWSEGGQTRLEHRRHFFLNRALPPERDVTMICDSGPNPFHLTIATSLFMNTAVVAWAFTRKRTSGRAE